MNAVLRKRHSLIIALIAVLCLVTCALCMGGFAATARADDEAKTVKEVVSHNDFQVISYGKLLADELDTTATVKYTDDTEGEEEIEYTEITAQTGVNVNFTSLEITGVIKGTDIKVKTTVLTMPDDLVYFINAGSSMTDNKYNTGIDPDYDKFEALAAYYGEGLKNSVPDRSSAKGSNDWGYYPANNNTVPAATTDSTYPYNTLLWKEKGDLELGYMLTSLTPNANYRIFIGSLSHWHARTVDVTFNGKVVGADTLRINASKGFTVFENVPADASGKIDLLLKGGETNEPNITFIAVQSMDTAYETQAPSAPVAAPTIGMTDHTVTFTSGMQAGAKIQLYNAARPYNLIYEETVDSEKIQDGKYTVDFGEPLSNVAQFLAVQINNGGVSGECLIAITDIQDFGATLSPDDYTTGSVTVTLTAHADSGIASWSYKKGEFGEVMSFDLDLPFYLDASFVATENADYYVVVTSGLGVTYSETVKVSNIDAARPVIEVRPSGNGWSAGSYNLILDVTSVAPVTSYTLYKKGVQIASSETAPSSVTLIEEGEYTFSVTNAAGVSSVCTVNVSNRPTTATVTKKYASRTLTYTFTDNKDYQVASVAASQVAYGSVSKMTVASDKSMDVYEAGTYVITVTTSNGTVEMFALEVSRSDLSAKADGISSSTVLGVGLGVGLGGVVLAAAAVVLVLLLTKKKKTATEK